MLWCSHCGVLGLEALAVHWKPALAIVETYDLSVMQWALQRCSCSSRGRERS
jgi:hypothetical protein